MFDQYPSKRVKTLSPLLVGMLLSVILIPLSSVAIEVGQPAPDFSLPTLTGGQSVGLKQLEGKVVVIDFWASWCQPCIKAFPELDAIQRDYGQKGVRVLAVSIDEEISSARKAIGKGGHSFTALHDATSKVADSFGVDGSLPATVVVDRQGRVRLFQKGGAVAPAQLRRMIGTLL